MNDDSHPLPLGINTSAEERRNRGILLFFFLSFWTKLQNCSHFSTSSTSLSSSPPSCDPQTRRKIKQRLPWNHHPSVRGTGDIVVDRREETAAKEASERTWKTRKIKKMRKAKEEGRKKQVQNKQDTLFVKGKATMSEVLNVYDCGEMHSDIKGQGSSKKKGKRREMAVQSKTRRRWLLKHCSIWHRELKGEQRAEGQWAKRDKAQTGRR